jgi:hypothetical protein
MHVHVHCMCTCACADVRASSVSVCMGARAEDAGVVCARVRSSCAQARQSLVDGRDEPLSIDVPIGTAPLAGYLECTGIVAERDRHDRSPLPVTPPASGDSTSLITPYPIGVTTLPQLEVVSCQRNERN